MFSSLTGFLVFRKENFLWKTIVNEKGLNALNVCESGCG